MAFYEAPVQFKCCANTAVCQHFLYEYFKEVSTHRLEEKARYTKGHVAFCEAPVRSRYCANSEMWAASFLKSTSSIMLLRMSPTIAASEMRESSGLMNSNTLHCIIGCVTAGWLPWVSQYLCI